VGCSKFNVLRQGGFGDRCAAEEILNNDSEIDLCASFVRFWFEGPRETAVVFSLSEDRFVVAVQRDVWIGWLEFFFLITV
jgi:hypothetical protein